MNNKTCAQVIAVLAVLLVLSPAYAFAAGAGTADQQTTMGQTISPERGTTWTCTYQQTDHGKPRYIRGRAGQIEYVRRPERTGQMQCKATTGDEVKVFRYCPT